MNKKEHTFVTRKITNEDIYCKLLAIEGHVKSQRWHNRIFYGAIGLLGTGYALIINMIYKLI